MDITSSQVESIVRKILGEMGGAKASSCNGKERYLAVSVDLLKLVYCVYVSFFLGFKRSFAVYVGKRFVKSTVKNVFFCV